MFTDTDIKSVIILLDAKLIRQIFHGYRSNRYDNIYIRRSNARLQEAVYGGLFGKTVGMDMKTMASPDYYDLFQFVLHQSADAILSALDMIFSYMSNIILLFLNGCLLFTYEPIYFFVMLSVIFSYFSSIAANKFQIKKNRALNPLQRKYEYIKRMFYMGNAAADIKTTNVHDLLLKEECEANLEIENTQKRYIFKLFKINWLSANILGRMPFLIMGVEALLTHIYTLGDTAVIISSMNNISQTLGPLANMYPQMQKNSEYIDDYIKYMETQGELGENPEGG